MEEPENYDCFVKQPHRGPVAYAYVVGGKLLGFLCEGCGENNRLTPRPIPIDEYLAGIREEEPRRCCVSDPGNHGCGLEDVDGRLYCANHTPSDDSVGVVLNSLHDGNGGKIIYLPEARQARAV